jgi:hypothetical protein
LFVPLASGYSSLLKDAEKEKRFFQPIVEDLNALQAHGLVINGVHLKFSFSTLAADNLAAHQIGGYQASFSSGYFCRRCHLSYDDRALPFSPGLTTYRTSPGHDQCLVKLAADPRGGPLFGIARPSVLMDLEGFHPTTSLPGDCMHDFLEGCCPIVVMALLKEASAAKLITYGETNCSSPCFLKTNLFFVI